MLVFGKFNNIPENFIPVNFTGMNESTEKLSINGMESIDVSTPEFDKYFAEVVYNNDDNFISFFRIIQLLMAGEDIYICISNGNVLDFLNESLAKFIQQRYGYNAVLINTEADYLYAVTSMNFGFAPGYGIYNLDQDKERFTTLIEQYRIANNGALPLDLEGFVVISDE